MRVQTCKFKWGNGSQWEMGLLIDEGKLIIDKNGRPVPAPIWNYYAYGDHVMTVDLERVPGEVLLKKGARDAQSS